MGGQLSSGCTVRQRRGRWFLCVDDDQKKEFQRVMSTVGPERIEELLRELFRLHDLNKNGLLEEVELIKVNEKIEILHKGEDLNKEEVREKYRSFFREKLDPDGKPVNYEVFRTYWARVLNEIDRDLRVQEMTLEQCVAEVESARQAFFIKDFQSQSDMPFLPSISCNGVLPSKVVSVPSSQVVAASSALSSGVGRQTPAWPATPDQTPISPAEEACFMPGSCESFDSEFIPTPSLSGDVSAREGFPSQRETGFPSHTSRQMRSMLSVDSDFVPSPSFVEPGTPPAPLDPLPEVSHVSSSNTSVSEPPQMPSNGSLRSLPGQESLPQMGSRHSEPTESLPPTASFSKPMESLPPTASFSKPVESLPPTATPASPQQVPQMHPSSTLVVGSRTGGTPPSESISRAPSLRSEAAARGEAAVRGFVKGDRVQVWSNSKSAWADAVVQETFPVQSMDEGYTMPAGTIKVQYDNGSRKWIQPQEVDSQLRRATRAAASTVAPHFMKGSSVQVWSDSRKAWLVGTVEQAYTEATQGEGYSIPAGTVKVRSDAGIKYVQPDQVSRTLRPLQSFPRENTPSWGQPLNFVRGEKIQVWSDSRQAWLGGTVEQVFPTAAKSDGFWCPAGTVKVSSEAGMKWVSPGRTAQVLRKMGAAATAERAGLVEALRDPERLNRHVDAAWAASGCVGSRGLSKDRAPWALEGLAMQFDVQLDLEGRHLTDLQKRLDAFPGDYLSRAQFQQLSQEIVKEVLGSL